MPMSVQRTNVHPKPAQLTAAVAPDEHGGRLEHTGERGFALLFRQDGGGVNGIAVPSVDRSACAVAGPSASLDPVPVERLAPDPVLSMMKDAAGALSRNLGYARFAAALVP